VLHSSALQDYCCRPEECMGCTAFISRQRQRIVSLDGGSSHHARRVHHTESRWFPLLSQCESGAFRAAARALYGTLVLHRLGSSTFWDPWSIWSAIAFMFEVPCCATGVSGCSIAALACETSMQVCMIATPCSTNNRCSANPMPDCPLPHLKVFFNIGCFLQLKGAVAYVTVL
jgi:hypothetical protein